MSLQLSSPFAEKLTDLFQRNRSTFFGVLNAPIDSSEGRFVLIISSGHGPAEVRCFAFRHRLMLARFCLDAIVTKRVAHLLDLYGLSK